MFSRQQSIPFFPPHAVLVSVLLLVPTRHWWAYTLCAAFSHFIATQQAGWPPLYAVHCEVFDAVQNVLTAAGIRLLIKSPFESITLRDAIVFILIAVVIAPFGTAFWGAAFTVSSHFATYYWIEWRNLGISNAVTALVLVPALLVGAHYVSAGRTRIKRSRLLEAGILGASILMVGVLAFDRAPAGPAASPDLLYAPIPLLVWAALRFGLGGTSVAMLIITSQAIWGTMHGRGPFLMQTPAENALALQIFILVTAAPLMLLTVAIDDERRSKEAWRVSEERMSLAVESAKFGIWIRDLARDEIWASDEWRAIFGFERTEPLSLERVLQRLHPEDRETILRVHTVAIESGGSYEAEYRVLLPDGQTRWIGSHGRAEFDRTGKAVFVRGVSRNITARKQVEQETLLLRQEVAHVGRVAMMGQLSSSLAHEINQPLGAILRNAEAAELFLQNPSPDLGEIRAILADIRKDDKRAGAVIDRMRRMLKRQTLETRTFEVGELIHEVAQLTRVDAQARRIKLEVEVPDGLAIRGDRVHLQQVLLNLILNGMDALNGSSAQDRRVALRARRSGEQTIEIAVSDRGPGIPVEELGHIFEPFFTTKPTGLGMGLPISRTIVEEHGGKLWVTNNADRGVTFHFTVRTAEGEAS